MESDDKPLENDAHSKTYLIDVQDVGVTASAELRSPMKRASSAETDNMDDLLKPANRKQYSKLSSEDSTASEPTIPPLSTISPPTTESSKMLYEMHAETRRSQRRRKTYSRIEFQLYDKSTKRLKHCRCQCQCQRGSVLNRRNAALRKRKRQRMKFVTKPSFMERLLTKLKLKEMHMTAAKLQSTVPAAQPAASSFPFPLPLPLPSFKRDGVYTFEQGCSDYLRVTDAPPLVFSNLLADRTTKFTTCFWAQFYGILYIFVGFIVTFLLQTYRFVLFSLVNTLLVGMLQMTSDYLIKPLLTITFNGFLQPPLIFLFNIMTSLRDLLKPIAETLNNFMKPFSTVGRSFRLVEANYKKKKFVKSV